MALNNKFFFLSPVEVVKVTPKNMQEVAEWCGGTIAKTESRHVKGRVDSYVQVPTPKGAAISWAFTGMYVTKRLAVTEKNELKATYSVFRKDYFSKNYFSDVKDAVDQTWERHEQEKRGAAVIQKAIEHGSITINISGASSPDEVTARVQEALNTGAMVQERKDIITPKAIPMVQQHIALHEEAVEAEAREPYLAGRSNSDIKE